jgi:hypothetical protein
MKSPTARWQERFSLTTCPAEKITATIPADALGVAVIYLPGAAGEEIFLVIESRARSLRAQCEKRLQTAKLPAIADLMVAFKGELLPDASAEAIQAACRQQVALAGELRRELRPAMR